MRCKQQQHLQHDGIRRMLAVGWRQLVLSRFWGVLERAVYTAVVGSSHRTCVPKVCRTQAPSRINTVSQRASVHMFEKYMPCIAPSLRAFESMAIDERAVAFGRSPQNSSHWKIHRT